MNFNDLGEFLESISLTLIEIRDILDMLRRGDKR